MRKNLIQFCLLSSLLFGCGCSFNVSTKRRGLDLSIPTPSFSKISGLYEDEFDLSLSSEGDYKIYYSLDCSAPNESSELYDGPIHIYDKSNEQNVLSSRTDICGTNIPYVPTSLVNKCMVVRAICYDDKGNYSPVVSSSYWINQNGFFLDNVPIISISTDFDNLFDSKKGIYCRGKIWDDWAASSDFNPDMGYWNQPGNYHQKGIEWEREGNVTYLNESHEVKCEQSIGMRIKGGATRGLPKKSFNLYSRKDYDGNGKFTYQFNDKECEKITLRAGGNNYNFMVTDPINSMIAKKCDLNMETQDTTPAYLFLNGEFWGIYFITDVFDSTYIEEKYGINDAMISKNGEIEEGAPSNKTYFDSAFSTICSDLTKESGFNKFCSKYHVNSFVDTFIYQSYIDHFDYDMFWSNTAYWRSKKTNNSINKCDGLIRFMLFDTDFSLGTHYDYIHYPRLFDLFKSSSSLKYIFDCPWLISFIKERANQIVNLISSDDCVNMVISYYNDIEPLIKQNNIRFYGKEEAGHTSLWNKLFAHLQNRSTYYMSFVNEL